MTSRLTRRGLLAGLGAMAARPLPAASPARLQARGAQLFYRERPILLRGVAPGDPLLGRAERPTEDYARIAQDWNANVVRLSVHPAAWKRQRAAVLAKLDRDVAAALAFEMFVIIDWHVVGWPDGWYSIPNPEQGQPDDLYDPSVALAHNFWAAIAARYGADGRIAFELWNEPNFALTGERDPVGRWQLLKPTFVGLIDTIRQHSDNLVLATNDQWGYDLRGIRQSLLDDGNVGYAWHIYANHDGDDPTRWAEKLDGLHEVAPVLVTEWGFGPAPGVHYNGTADSFGKPFARFMGERRLHHTAWCWHPYWGPPMLLADWQGTTDYGAFVKDLLTGYGIVDRP